MTVVSVAALAGPVCGDIIARGWREYRYGRSPDSNHGLNDRAAVGWLMDQRRPGDVVMTTHLGVPAFWWYGGIPLSGPSAGGTLPDGTPIVEVGIRSGDECAPDHLRALLGDRRRVLVYSGFPDQPAGFDDLLLARLSAYGTVTAERRFAASSRAAVLELRAAPGVSGATDVAAAVAPATPLDGCIGGMVTERW